MADRAMMRTITFRLLVAGFVVIAAACGTTGKDRSTSDSSTLTAQANASVTPSSPVPSSDASSSLVPSSAVPSSLVPSSLVPSSAVPSDGTGGGPVCDGGLLPATAAIDRTTGEFQWTYCSAELARREVRGATDDIVYVDTTMPDPSASASEYRQLNAVIALDARSGTELWRVAVARQQLGWPPGPFTGGGVVVVQVDDDAGAAIVGVDADTGETRWRVTEAELDAITTTSTSVPTVSASPGPPPGPPSVHSPLANTDEVVVLSALTGLVGLDRRSGEWMWSSDVSLLDESGVGAARGPAAVDGSTVIVPAASEVVSAHDPSGAMVTIPIGPSALIAVDGSTGAKLWQGPRLDHPVAAEGHAVGYVHTGPPPFPSEVIVVDATTGEQLWSKPGVESYGDLWAVGDGAVYVKAVSDRMERGVVAYELESGAERWRRSSDMSTPDGLWLGRDPQQVADDAVVLLWDALTVLSTTDGTARWTSADWLTMETPPETPMSSVGHNAASILVSFNSLPWTD